jgi:hypothetical protein
MKDLLTEDTKVILLLCAVFEKKVPKNLYLYPSTLRLLAI